jgi:deoxyribodipyrimidine photo-lyase
MHREHRAADNHGLLLAQDLALARGVPLAVAHCLDPDYPGAVPGHFAFLLAGLEETARDLAALSIPFLSLTGHPPREVARLARALRASALVTDFDPLRHKRAWLAELCAGVDVPVWEVDSRNVVPCRLASGKAEYMARTLRPKIHRLLPDFLVEPPPLVPHPHPLALPADTAGIEGAWDRLFPHGPARPSDPYPRFPAGERAARKILDRFLGGEGAGLGPGGLAAYHLAGGDPGVDGQSGLSPYLHFGMISAQRAALEASASPVQGEGPQAFLEQLIVRRELAENFCLHHPDYDTPGCFPAWATATLAKHGKDPRPALYSREELTHGRTADPWWNAAQAEMRETGSMHGYLRMYWCKKILEWSPTAAQAMDTAVALNDRFSLDGRDPNGYAGIAWSIGGVHDRPWTERPVFGTVRCMTAGGLTRKFDMGAYVARVEGMAGLRL